MCWKGPNVLARTLWHIARLCVDGGMTLCAQHMFAVEWRERIVCIFMSSFIHHFRCLLGWWHWRVWECAKESALRKFVGLVIGRQNTRLPWSPGRLWPPQSPWEQGHCHLHRKTVGLSPAWSALSAFSPPSHSGAWLSHCHAEHCEGSERFGSLFESSLVGYCKQAVKSKVEILFLFNHFTRCFLWFDRCTIYSKVTLLRFWMLWTPLL